MSGMRSGLFGILSLGVIHTACAQTVPDSITIPLQRVTNKHGEPRLHIMVSLGGGPKVPYLFDTGGSGFFSAASASAWPTQSMQIVSPAAQNPPQVYGDGVHLAYDEVTTSIDIGLGFPINNVVIAHIVEAWGGHFGERGTTNWKAGSDAAGEFSEGNFGNFGADLRSGTGLFSVLPQLPGNLSSGFIVRTGGINGESPQLVIGLTDELRNEFPIKVKMNPGTGQTFPNSNLNLYAQSLVTGNFSLQKGAQQVNFTAGTILDTGAPTTHLFLPGGIEVPQDFYQGNRAATGISVGMAVQSSAQAPQSLLDFPAGEQVGVDYVSMSRTEEQVPMVNSGITIFFRYDVMFDLQNGVVGFKPMAN